MSQLHRLDQRGFTIVELILALTIATIMSGVLLLVTFRFYTNAAQSQQSAEMALESQTLLSQITEDLRLSASVNSTNVITDANKSGGWQTNDANNVIVISVPAVNSSHDIIYDPNTGFPYTNEVIYFVQNKNMYKRILKNTNAPGNIASTTCPKAAATSSCLEDRVFSENADGLSFIMYNSNNTTVTDTTQAKSLQLTVDFSKNVFGRTISLSNTTRVTQRN